MTTTAQSNCVFIRDVAPTASSDDLRAFFSFCGKIETIGIRPGTKLGTQEALVQFAGRPSADTALLLNSAIIRGSAISVAAATITDLEDFGLVKRATVENPATAAHSNTVTASAPADTAASVTSPAAPTPSVTSSHSEAEVTTQVPLTGNEPATTPETPPPQLQVHLLESRTSTLARLAAAGYVLGEDAVQAATSLDEKHGRKVGNFTDRSSAYAKGMDERYYISIRAKAVGTIAKDRASSAARAVDQKLGVTQKVEAVQQNEKVQKVSGKLGQLKQAASEKATQLKDQTQKAIDEKRAAKAAKAAAAGTAPATGAPATVPAATALPATASPANPATAPAGPV